MKKLFGIVCLFLCVNSFAVDRYFSSSTGNDANAGTLASPWQTINKLNSIWSTLNSGDRVLLKRGDVFYGALRPTKSFAVGNPVQVTSYGTGADPIITGFVDIAAWTNLGSNIWESTIAPSTLPTCNMVVINGVNYPMGRFPNSGYLTYQSFTQTTLTSTSLNSATTNWTGATAVIRKNNWITEGDTITSHAGSTIVHTWHGSANGQANYGFFIENDLRTLDAQNEWYYSPSSKRLRIYSTSMPTNVQVSTIDTLVWTKQFDNIRFDSIKFTGSNVHCFTLPGSSHIEIRNCTFDFHGRDLVWAYMNVGAGTGTGFIFDYNIVNHVNNNGLQIAQEHTNSSISHNTFKNIGLFPGMLQAAKSNQTSAEAVQARSINTMIEWNRIDSVGYVAIYWLCSNVTIRYNHITEAMRTKQDGGLIYTWNGIPGAAAFTNQKIYNNLCLNSSGQSSMAGTTQTASLVHGIYLDANTRNVEVYNNTCANLGYGGGYNYSGSSNNNWHHNLFYNNTVNQFLLIDQHPVSNGSVATTNDTIYANIFFSKAANQLTGKYTSSVSAGTFFGTLGLLDSNYYARPIDDNTTIQFMSTNYTIAGWKTVSGKEPNSNKGPFTVVDTSKIKFVYNDTTVAKVFTLGAIYVDVKNVTYNNTITLQPFTGAALIYSSALINTPPVAVAGANQVVIGTSATVDGSASFDPDGTIVTYAWTQISGSLGPIIVLPNNAVTNIVSMTPGQTYGFRLTVTDNNSATGSDDMTLTSNIVPTVGAGVDQTITLPTSTITFAGTASDPDGSVTSTLWTQLSGPNTASITTPGSLTSGVTGLIQGVYQFQLSATDNLGGTNSDNMQVTVNPVPANIPPTANAGVDSTITLPRDSVHLLGSGTDTDGTIVSYNWSQVSGPNTATIATPAAQNTLVSGLITGIYKFKIIVVDNDGSPAFDTVQVTVNPLPNVPPVANAGVDQAIVVDHSTLLGSGTDSDGTITSYSWVQNSGPNTANIAFPTQAITAVDGMITGTYVFELTVTDDDGGVDTDTVQIIVGAIQQSKLIIIRGNIIFEK